MPHVRIYGDIERKEGDSTVTKKYYINAILAAPFLCALMCTSNLPWPISAAIGFVTQMLLINGGYYLGKREHEKDNSTTK